ncbi:MAG TPA: squalene synthase HpnC [Xanthobacteraceae bacterium]|jgi:squalene synthase HpnC|nr:squalene synthase HpnC [Xanthobacteraceae bacterium]
MTIEPADWRSGKSHRDENFPVASRFVRPRHRAAILAFYNFVRTADDIADHSTLSPAEKLHLLDRMEAGLLGDGDGIAEAVTLQAALREQSLSPQHARDLLQAFRMDVDKLRYRDWDDLLNYCRYSAMPVGRFVLDVHGEDRSTWSASDPLCAALQIINHLQDCAADYRNLDRVYVPLDALASAGAAVEDLGRERASPALLACLRGLARRTRALLAESSSLAGRTRDFRLAMEISVIQSAARRLLDFLDERDPLSERVHLNKAEFALAGLSGVVSSLLGRMAPDRRLSGNGVAREQKNGR